MDGEAFDTYVRTQLAPSLEAGDVVVLDNLNVHKSPRAAQAVAERGAWLLLGPVAGLVGNEGGVVSGVINLESSGVEASDWRPRHDEHYHEA